MTRLLTLLCLLLPAAARAGEPKAATPEDLVVLLQDARKTGDLKAELPLLGGPHRPLAEQALEVLEAGRAFDKALDDKFGKDPDYRSNYATRIGAAKRVELKGKKDLGGDKVELTLWTTRVEGETEVVVESREVALKENGGWVLRAPVPFSAVVSREETRQVGGREVTVRVESPAQDLTAAELGVARVAVPRLRTVLERGAKDVAAGKHASRKAAVAAVDKAVEDILTVEPGRATSGEKKDRE